MANIIIPKLGLYRTKPRVGASIDYTHPLSKNISFALLLNEYGANAIFDLVQHKKAIFSNGSFSRGPYGIEYVKAVAAEGALFDGSTTKQWNTGKDWTVSALLKMTDGNSGAHILLSKFVSSGDRTTVYIDDSTNTYRMGARGDNITLTGDTISIVKYSLYTWVYKEATTAIEFYQDGIPRGGGTLDCNDSNIGINFMGNTIFMGGRVVYLYVHQRALKIDEIIDLKYNPYGFIRPYIKTVYFVLGTGVDNKTTTPSKTLISIIANVASASKQVSKTATIIKTDVRINTGTLSASRYMAAYPQKATVSIIANAVTASRNDVKIATTTTATVRILTNSTVGEIPAAVDTKTATLTKAIVSILTNTATANKQVNKTAQLVQSLISIIANTTTATKQTNKIASTTKPEVFIIANTVTASKGADKTAQTTIVYITITTNTVTVSKTQNKIATATQTVIRIVTGTTLGKIPVEVGIITITILAESKMETSRRHASRIDKYLNYDSAMQTVNNHASRMDKYINEDSEMQTTVNLASDL